MWTVKSLTAVDDKGNSVTFEDEKITVAVKLDNGFRVTKTFLTGQYNAQSCIENVSVAQQKSNVTLHPI